MWSTQLGCHTPFKWVQFYCNRHFCLHYRKRSAAHLSRTSSVLEYFLEVNIAIFVTLSLLMMDRRLHKWSAKPREALKKIFHSDKTQNQNLLSDGEIQEIGPSKALQPKICTSPTSNLDILDSLQAREAYRTFEYSPLGAQEIRLLTLLPGTFNSSVHICLETVIFTNELIPEFEALSYTWGSQDNPVDFFVKDMMDGSPSNFATLAVTSNLAEALPFLRYGDRPRVFWD